MRFRPKVLKHRERVKWAEITHVRLKSTVADTSPCQTIVDHINEICDRDGIAPLEFVLKNFPAVRKELDHRVASLQDLRHMANLRESGGNSENKGLIEIGTLDGEEKINDFPDEVTNSPIWEGAKLTVKVNKYERSPAARRLCLKHWGFDCTVCGFNFERNYGGRGSEFIHVHHLKPVSEIGESYEIDPVNDLRPVCPNCHAMLHRFDPPASPEEIRRLLTDMSVKRS